MFATRYGHTDIVRILINAGAALNLVDNDSWSALMNAAEHGHTDIVRILVDAGCQLNLVDKNHWSPLTCAARNGHTDAVWVLIEAGAQVDLVDKDNWSPLMFAARNGHTDALWMLMVAGADFNLVDKESWSPLMSAARNGHAGAVRMLIDAGAQLDLVNSDSWTTLMLVASGGSTDIARMLVEAGANVNASDNKDRTVLLRACVNNSHDIVKILLQHGARVDADSLKVAQSEDIHSILQLYHSSQQFHDQTFSMFGEASAGMSPLSSQVLELVPFITSVYDLRLLLTLNSMVDPPNDGTTKLLDAAFAHILSQKLVLDDDACVYFHLVLERCVESRMLSQFQFTKWKVKATKVNVESAEWVVELKKHVNENIYRLQVHEQAIGAVVQGIHSLHQEVRENHSMILDTNDRVKLLQSQVETGEKVLKSLFGFTNQLATSVSKQLIQCEANIQSVASSLQAFQNGYKQRLQQEERSRYIKASCGLLASVVGFTFAPLLKTVFDSVIDMANPIEIFNHAYKETDIVGFLAENGCENLLKPAVQDQLEKYAIPTIEFETLLRQGIILKTPELVSKCQRHDLTLAAVDMDYANEVRALVPSLLNYESRLANTLKELDLVTVALKAETWRSPIKTHGESVQMKNPKSIDQKELISKCLSTAHSSKAATPPRQPDNNGKTHTSSDDEVVTFVEDLEAIPYHLAVMESHGNLREFQDLSDVIDDDVDCVNAVTEVRLMKQQTQNVTINAADYAQLLGYSQLASLISSQMGISTPPQSQNQVFVTFSDDIQTCPFFVAVQESEGDVDEFKQWLEVLECEDDQIGTKVCATINWEEDTDLKKWSPVELACHFGYVDIVKHLLLKKRAKTGERNITVMTRAKDRARTLTA